MGKGSGRRIEDTAKVLEGLEQLDWRNQEPTECERCRGERFIPAGRGKRRCPECLDR